MGIRDGYIHPHPNTQLKKINISHIYTHLMREFYIKNETIKIRL